MIDIRNILNKIKKYSNLRLIDNNIQIELKEDKKINLDYIQKLINEVKENKNDAIRLLKYQSSLDYRLKSHEHILKRGYLNYEDLKLYSKQITVNSFIFIQLVDDLYFVYRRTYEENKFKSEKIILKDIDLMYCLNAAEKYINNYLNFIKKTG